MMPIDMIGIECTHMERGKDMDNTPFAEQQPRWLVIVLGIIYVVVLHLTVKLYTLQTWQAVIFTALSLGVTGIVYEYTYGIPNKAKTIQIGMLLLAAYLWIGVIKPQMTMLTVGAMCGFFGLFPGFILSELVIGLRYPDENPKQFWFSVWLLGAVDLAGIVFLVRHDLISAVGSVAALTVGILICRGLGLEKLRKRWQIVIIVAALITGLAGEGSVTQFAADQITIALFSSAAYCFFFLIQQNKRQMPEVEK